MSVKKATGTNVSDDQSMTTRQPDAQGRVQTENADQALNAKAAQLQSVKTDSESQSRKTKSIGIVFREVREGRGATVDNASRALRISSRYITAIEEMAPDRLPEKVYTLGFVRSYAVYLGIDPDKALSKFKSEIYGLRDNARHTTAMEKPQPSLRSASQRRYFLYGVSVVAVVAAAGLVHSMWTSMQTSDGNQHPDAPALQENSPTAPQQNKAPKVTSPTVQTSATGDSLRDTQSQPARPQGSAVNQKSLPSATTQPQATKNTSVAQKRVNETAQTSVTQKQTPLQGRTKAGTTASLNTGRTSADKQSEAASQLARTNPRSTTTPETAAKTAPSSKTSPRGVSGSATSSAGAQDSATAAKVTTAKPAASAPVAPQPKTASAQKSDTGSPEKRLSDNQSSARAESPNKAQRPTATQDKVTKKTVGVTVQPTADGMRKTRSTTTETTVREKSTPTGATQKATSTKSAVTTADSQKPSPQKSQGTQAAAPKPQKSSPATASNATKAAATAETRTTKKVETSSRTLKEGRAETARKTEKTLEKQTKKTKEKAPAAASEFAPDIIKDDASTPQDEGPAELLPLD